MAERKSPRIVDTRISQSPATVTATTPNHQPQPVKKLFSDQWNNRGQELLDKGNFFGPKQEILLSVEFHTNNSGPVNEELHPSITAQPQEE